ncbi:MAG: ABC transporter permease [Ruminococcus sp.]|jgi:ribose transport system permease protein
MKKCRNFIEQYFSLVVLLSVLLILFFCSDYPISAKIIMNILTQNAYIITVTMGMAVLMISGSVDISVGSQVSLIGILCARMLTEKEIPAWIVIVTAIALGISLNFLHMLLAVWWKLPMLLISIGMMTLYQGIVDLMGTARPVLIYDQTFRYIGTRYLGPVSLQFLIACIMAAGAFFLMHKTYPGRYIYAVGSNSTAASLSGINVTKVKLLASVFYGFTVAAGTLIHTSRLGSAYTGMGDEIAVAAITAGLLGGISIRGGTGRISGVFLMILSLSGLSYINLMTSYGVHYRNLLNGSLLLLSFGYDFYRRRRRQRMENTRI